MAKGGLCTRSGRHELWGVAAGPQDCARAGGNADSSCRCRIPARAAETESAFALSRGVTGLDRPAYRGAPVESRASG